MQRHAVLLAAALIAFTLTAISTPAYTADVGVSLSVGQPGFYGRINIGNRHQPQVLYRQPIAIQRVPMNRPPIYLRVPPEHAKQWNQHCRDYNACDERVLFVQDSWYKQQFRGRSQGSLGNGRGQSNKRQRQGRKNGSQHQQGHGR